MKYITIIRVESVMMSQSYSSHTGTPVHTEPSFPTDTTYQYKLPKKLNFCLYKQHNFIISFHNYIEIKTM